jgi:hypothetical protein
MTLDEILRDIHALEEDMLTYERKYGVLTETFYESYSNGEEPADDAWVLDWSDWAAAYEIWLRRREQYQEIIQALRESTPTLADVIAKTARRESLPVPA